MVFFSAWDLFLPEGFIMVCGKCETVGVGATTTRAKQDVFAKSFYIVGREFISRRLFEIIRGGTKAPPYGVRVSFARTIGRFVN